MQNPFAKNAWAKAFYKTILAQRTIKFTWIGDGVFAVLGSSWLTLIAPTGASIPEMLLRAVVGGLGGLFVAIVFVFLFNLVIKNSTFRVASSELHYSFVKFQFVSCNPIKLDVNFGLTVTGKTTLKQAKIEIKGIGKYLCEDWPEYDIEPFFATTVFGKACTITHELTKKEYRLRLRILANDDWWLSDWETVPFELTNLNKTN